jgi:hypothetical protein
MPFVAFTQSLLGFLLGVTISGGVGYYYLLEEYNAASATLLSSVQDLQASTEKVKFDINSYIPPAGAGR